MNDKVIEWLSEDSNPMVKYRTQKEILKLDVSNGESINFLMSYLPADWYTTKGLWYTNYLTSLAEAGLTKDDLKDEWLEQAYMRLNPFNHGCEDFMLLRALVMLGCGVDPTVLKAISDISNAALPDGGFLCRMKLDKKTYVPKGCYKANLMALLLASECKKKGLDAPFAQALLDNLRRRNIFYKTGTNELVLQEKTGWRTVDVFYPPEVMRVGIVYVFEALASLSGSSDPCLKECKDIIESNMIDGKVILQGTSTKTYLPKEKVGKPSKWNTFYYIIGKMHE